MNSISRIMKNKRGDVLILSLILATTLAVTLTTLTIYSVNQANYISRLKEGFVMMSVTEALAKSVSKSRGLAVAKLDEIGIAWQGRTSADVATDFNASVAVGKNDCGNGTGLMAQIPAGTGKLYCRAGPSFCVQRPDRVDEEICADFSASDNRGPGGIRFDIKTEKTPSFIRKAGTMIASIFPLNGTSKMKFDDKLIPSDTGLDMIAKLIRTNFHGDPGSLVSVNSAWAENACNGPNIVYPSIIPFNLGNKDGCFWVKGDEADPSLDVEDHSLQSLFNSLSAIQFVEANTEPSVNPFHENTWVLGGIFSSLGTVEPRSGAIANLLGDELVTLLQACWANAAAGGDRFINSTEFRDDCMYAMTVARLAIALELSERTSWVPLQGDPLFSIPDPSLIKLSPPPVGFSPTAFPPRVQPNMPQPLPNPDLKNPNHVDDPIELDTGNIQTDGQGAGAGNSAYTGDGVIPLTPDATMAEAFHPNALKVDCNQLQSCMPVLGSTTVDGNARQRTYMQNVWVD